MLVLQMNTNEKIIIGEGEDKVELFFFKRKGGNVRIGIRASSKTPITREKDERSKNKKR